MSEQMHRAVLHLRGGKTIRCELDRYLHEEDASVQVHDAEGTHEVSVGDLKAAFFLRDAAAPLSPLPDQQTRIAVEFADGEVIRGVAGNYSPAQARFYLFPDDRSKSERIFVVTSAVVSIDVEKL